jgi:DNA polymerase III subunit beta
MNFTIDASDLTHALRLASRAVSNGRTAPILANVLIKTSDDAIEVTGFDLEIGIHASAPATITAPGTLTLPARLLTDLASSLSGTLTVAAVADAVTITSATGTYSVQGISAEDYPAFPVATAPPFKLPAAPFLDAIAVALTAVSSDESKQALTGVNVTFGQVIEAAATDGHRLAMMTAGTISSDITVPFDVQMEVTVPGRALSELRRIATDDTLGITLDPGQITVTSGATTLTARTFDAKYPDYRKLIPQSFKHQATLNRREFLSALQRVAIMADQSNSVIKLTGTDNTLSIAAESAGLGSAGESIAAQITGSPDAAFNGHYLIDALKANSSDTVSLELNSPTTPAIITADDQPDFLYLIMPVQVKA